MHSSASVRPCVHGHTYCAILGLVISSPVVILMGTDMGNINIIAVLTGLVCLVAGVFASRQLGK